MTKPRQVVMGKAGDMLGVFTKMRRFFKHNNARWVFLTPVPEKFGVLPQHQVHVPVDLKRCCLP